MSAPVRFFTPDQARAVGFRWAVSDGISVAQIFRSAVGEYHVVFTGKAIDTAAIQVHAHTDGHMPHIAFHGSQALVINLSDVHTGRAGQEGTFSFTVDLMAHGRHLVELVQQVQQVQWIPTATAPATTAAKLDGVLYLTTDDIEDDELLLLGEERKADDFHEFTFQGLEYRFELEDIGTMDPSLDFWEDVVCLNEAIRIVGVYLIANPPRSAKDGRNIKRGPAYERWVQAVVSKVETATGKNLDRWFYEGEDEEPPVAAMLETEMLTLWPMDAGPAPSWDEIRAWVRENRDKLR